MSDLLFCDFTVLDAWVLGFFTWNIIGALIFGLVIEWARNPHIAYSVLMHFVDELDTPKQDKP